MHQQTDMQQRDEAPAQPEDSSRRSTRSRNPSLVAREAANNKSAAEANRKQRKRTIYLLQVPHGDTDPKTFDQALNAPDSEHWLAAMQDEINQMNILDAWSLCCDRYGL
jgi:hypothetical protein